MFHKALADLKALFLAPSIIVLSGPPFLAHVGKIFPPIASLCLHFFPSQMPQDTTINATLSKFMWSKTLLFLRLYTAFLI